MRKSLQIKKPPRTFYYKTVIVTIREELLCIKSGKEPKLELAEKNRY